MCLSVSKHAPAEYATNLFVQFQIEIQKISRCGSRSPDNAEFDHFRRCCFAEDGKEMHLHSHCFAH